MPESPAGQHVTPSNPPSHPLVYLDRETPLRSFLSEIASVSEIAVDTEGASFHRFVDRIYLLQLSTRERSAIIDPLPFTVPAGIGAALYSKAEVDGTLGPLQQHLEDAVPPLAALGAILQNPLVEVVFHDADYDLRLLHQDYGWNPTNIFDTRIAAQLLGISSVGLAALLESNFGVKLDKKHQRADWSMRPLTKDMLDYAAQDTRYLLDLKEILKQQLVDLNRWSWAKEEFDRLEGTRWEPEDESTAYLRVKGARDLTRRELAILRELVPWRDGVARALDRSTFRVVGNPVLLDIARAAPQSIPELAKIKGTPKGMLDRIGNDIVAAVKRGLAVPDADLPKFPRGLRYERDPNFDAKVDRARSVREAAATKLKIDPGILFSRDRLETVVRNKPQTRGELLDVPGVRRWQVDVMGEKLLEAIR